MFHTPPTKASHTTFTRTSTEDDDPLSTGMRVLSAHSDNEENDDDELPHELPRELAELVQNFLKDLRAPKYTKPISAEQLSAMFQDFYALFRYRTELFVKGSVFYKTRTTKIEMLTKDEQESRKKVLKRMENRVKQYVELAEEELTTSVFDRLFNKFEGDVAVNTYIKNKLTALQKVKGIDYSDLLDVEGVDFSHPNLAQLSHCLAELTNLQTPLSKIELLLKVHTLLNTFLKEHLDTSAVSGDYILPLFIYIILIHREPTDLYLHFLFIFRFRNQAYLNAEPLYCLTNFEAALTYVQSLIINQDSLDFSALTDAEYLILSNPSDLPLRRASIVQQVLPDASASSLISPIPVAAEGFKSLGTALDTGFKTMFHKFGPVEVTESYNPLNRLAGVMKWRSNTPSTSATPMSETKEIMEEKEPIASDPGIDLKKFEKMNEFKELTVSQLEEVWNDYKILVDWVKAKDHQ